MFLCFHYVLKILGENLPDKPENWEDVAGMFTALSSCHEANEQCVSWEYKITFI